MSDSTKIAYPGCTREPSECRISMRTEMTTYVAWTPVYDGNGLLTNSDPNKVSTVYSCDTCGESWTADVEGGVRTVNAGPVTA